MPLRWAVSKQSSGHSPDWLLRPRGPGCLSDRGSYAFGGGSRTSDARSRTLLHGRAKVTERKHACQSRPLAANCCSQVGLPRGESNLLHRYNKNRMRVRVEQKPCAVDEEITLKTSSNSARRRFIKLTAVGLSAAPLAAAFTSRNAFAAEALSETDPQASALGYKTDATKAANRKDANAVCSNCNLYTGKAGDASGPCTIFAGKLVNAKGWCSAWVKKT